SDWSSDVCSSDLALFFAAASEVGARSVELHAFWKHHDHIFHGREHVRLERKASRIRKVITDLELCFAWTDWKDEAVSVLFARRNWRGIDRHAARTSSQ